MITTVLDVVDEPIRRRLLTGAGVLGVLSVLIELGLHTVLG